MKRIPSFFREKNPFRGLSTFLFLWATQAFSALGSSMTSFALIIWSYQQKGTAMTTSLLSVCSYAPYVLLSIFAGALSDRWDKKRTMLLCDSCAVLTTVCVFALLLSGRLEVWHLYILNTINGLMNAFQSPASTTAVTLIVPKEQFHRISGLQAFSNSLVTILTPILATAVLAFGGITTVIIIDLVSFAIAFISLAFFIKIPHTGLEQATAQESVWKTAMDGLRYLRHNRGILDLILFMAVINLIASTYDAIMPPMLLSRNGGSTTALGLVNTFVGVANVAGSLLVSLLPPPKSRVRVIFNAITLSMATENLLLAVGRNLPIWCVGAVLGWIAIPFLNANMNTILRLKIPVEMQGRVYSARNTLQFFTIPLGFLVGGALNDYVFEPMMATPSRVQQVFSVFVGTGKGSGAAALFLVLAVLGTVVCLIARRDKRIWELDQTEESESGVDAP